jgi:glycosyltransferase involved in cell wall biosynthesis
MQDIVIFVGSLKNPYPYLKLMDILFVPSRYEGKPMVVTEAQMLGVVPFVSEYSSAYEQIIPNVDGFIAENLENEIMQKLEGLMKDTDILNKVKKTLLSRDYSNQDEIEKFYDLISE